MKFPIGMHASAGEYWANYSRAVATAVGLVDRASMEPPAEIFVYRLQTFASAGDGLLTISASGNSENVVRAVEWARKNGVATIAMTGLRGPVGEAGGCQSAGSGEQLWVVEDVHQSMMRVFAQYLRMRSLDPDLVGSRNF
jgi:D-sedoheptulose 7-phosphate isomerase